MRVHELAKEFGVKSTDFVDIIQGFGISVSSHLSGLDNAQVSDIRHKMILKKEAEDADINPMGNISQADVDRVTQRETTEDFNARRREEIVEEKKRVANRERASQVIDRAKENKKEQHLKLERAGLWGWVKGLFS